jgi:GTPase SAR1 family protein
MIDPNSNSQSTMESLRLGQNQQPQLETLQQEVSQLLQEICTLINDTQENLSGVDSSEKKYQQLLQQVQKAGESVADLQLRMAIVAPMKAGKSTIINAIIGQELLPSCATAMTTIPTEIVFNGQLTEPILNISQQTISIFQDIYISIKQQIKLLGIELVKTKIARYPHLLDLLIKIQNTTDFTFSQEIFGREAIAITLNRLNHLIRLCSAIDPLLDPLGKLTEIPRIETSFLNLANKAESNTLGNLVIIDTPGPNEAGENLRLTTVVEEQLRRSSIVLIVLDFTQLNNEAAEAIKKQIQPIIELIGQKNLYILVNKIDQRRQGDMTSQQVKEFVLADLQLSQVDDIERVFEISAIRAFAATKFLRELQENPHIKLEAMTTAKSFAQEVFGIDWEEELAEATVDNLVIKAKKLWEKSGFAPFLEQAIAALMINAAPHCLLSALNLSRHHLLDLRDDLNLYNKAISQDSVKLQTEVQALETDLNFLESRRTRLTEIEQIKAKLQQKLTTILSQLKQEVKVNIEDYFVEEDFERGDLFKKADIKTRELLLTNIGSFELFPKWISENLKSNLEYKTAGIAAFKAEKDAVVFADKATAWAKERAEKILTQVRQHTEQEIETTRKNLADFLIKETKPIIEQVKTRLQDNFELELSLPSPIIKAEENLGIGQHLIKSKTRLIDEGYEYKWVEKRAWYYWFGLVSFNRQEIHKKPYKKEKYYSVSIHDLVEDINRYLETAIDTIKQKITVYLDEDLQDQVDTFFASLDDYLNNYRNNLQQAQATQKLSLEQQLQLSNNLNHLVPQAGNYIQEAENYLELTEQFLSKN